MFVQSLKAKQTLILVLCITVLMTARQMLIRWKSEPVLVLAPPPAPGSALLPGPPPGAVPPPQDLPSHPAFARNCYRYFSDLSTENLCRKKLNLTDRLETLHTCFRRASQHAQPSNSTVWLVLLGDSHIRYIFTSLLFSFHSTTLQYLIRKTWTNVADLEEIMPGKKTVIADVRDTSINLRLTLFIDPFMKKLPDLLQHWLSDPDSRPSYFVFGAGLHSMRESHQTFHKFGPQAAMTPYVKSLHKLKPSLTQLARHTTVVFKLIDDTMRAHQKVRKNPQNFASNYFLYNTAAINQLEGTGVVVWDSTLPLSFGYTAACNSNPRTTPPYYYWKCDDNGHVGYILVNQYADMIINDFCSHYI